jgi:hypothetical protein
VRWGGVPWGFEQIQGAVADALARVFGCDAVAVVAHVSIVVAPVRVIRPDPAGRLGRRGVRADEETTR